MASPSGGGDEKTLGRREHSEKRARRADRLGRLHWRRFYEPGKLRLSVDYFAPDEEQDAATIATAELEAAGGTFYGWGCLSRDHAARNGRVFRESPTSENPFHSDIHLPDDVEGDEDERRKHAFELADLTQWRRYGGPTA